MQLLRILTIFAIYVVTLGVDQAGASSIGGCLHSPGNVWFYGEHMESSAFGVIEDAHPDRIVKFGQIGHVLLVTKIEVLDIIDGGNFTNPPRVGQIVTIAQFHQCTNCNASRLAAATDTGIYTLVGQRAWFDASPPFHESPSAALAVAGIEIDFEVSNQCGAWAVRQGELELLEYRD